MSESYSNRQLIVMGPRVEGTYSPYSRSTKTNNVTRLITTTTRVSNNLPGYFARKARGEPLPWTGFTFNKTTRLYPFGTEDWLIGVTHYTLDGCLGSDPDDPLISEAYDNSLQVETERLASQKLLSNAKAQKLNMGTFLAESGKSIDMIARTASKFYEAYRSVRKGNLFDAAGHLGIAPSRRRQKRFNRTAKKDHAKAVASAWLELQYGWKPLLMDTYNAAQEIADNVSPIFVGHAFGKHAETRVRQTKTNVDTDTVNIYSEARYKCTFVMENTVARRAALNGLSNPMMVAWELVPYSFVVDWFLPIGDYLSRIDATNGLNFKLGGVVSYQKATYTRVRVFTGSRQRRSEQSVESLRVSRGSLSKFPDNTTPSFKNPLSLGHAINAVALLTNFWK